MRSKRCGWFRWTLLAGLAFLLGVSSTRAQVGGKPRSLGGYGAASIGAAYSNRGGPLIPYGGGQGGFIPYAAIESRRAAEPVMTPREIPQTMIGGAGNARTPIGGVSRMQGPDIYQPLNYRGRFGMGGSFGLPPRYGPGFGSPFRRPPLLPGGGM